MTHLDEETALRQGGWDPRYATVLVVVTRGDIAAALVDTNSDGADIDLDEYWLGPNGEWEPAGSSGSAGEFGSSWSPHMVARYGRGDPGATVTLDYLGETHQVTATERGWWLFIAPPRDEGTLVEVSRGG